MIDVQLEKGTLLPFFRYAIKRDLEEQVWQFYLSRVYDKSYNEWKEGLKNG